MRVFDPARLKATLVAFIQVGWIVDYWIGAACAAVCLYAIVCGIERRRQAIAAPLIGIAVIAVMVAVYVFVVASSVQPPKDYAHSAVDRLYVQLWPALVFSLFALTRVPWPVSIGQRAAVKSPANWPRREGGD